METVRAFIAIELPSSIQNKLGEIINRLKNKSPGVVRWVQPQNIHITLKFLGDVTIKNLPALTQLLFDEAGQYNPFEISIGGLGAFPNRQRPRVIWVGAKAPPILETLQSSIETKTRQMGYASEDKAFSPHLTIGRVSHNASQDDIRQIAVILSNMQVEELGFVAVEAIRLFKSDLKPAGAVYTAIAGAPLKQ